MTSPAAQSGPGDRERLEREWLGRVRLGDERAFEEIFRTFIEPLFNFAVSYVEAGDVAEEIVQDLFCALWEQRFTLEMPRGMRPYLYTAVRNRALNVLRNKQVELAMHDRFARDRGDRAEESTALAADSGLIARDLAEALARVIGEMLPRCREVFTMHRYQHLSYAEVAQVLGISTKTVEIHMSRALAILRERLAPFLET